MEKKYHIQEFYCSSSKPTIGKVPSSNNIYAKLTKTSGRKYSSIVEGENEIGQKKPSLCAGAARRKLVFPRSSTIEIANYVDKNEAIEEQKEEETPFSRTSPPSSKIQINDFSHHPLSRETSPEEELSASLSPSPFKRAEMKEVNLKEMVASTQSLFDPIYNKGQSPIKSLTKKALQDYILHALQSIVIIKKLTPLTEPQIDMHKITLHQYDPSKIILSH